MPTFQGVPYFQSLLQLLQPVRDDLVFQSHSPLLRLSSATAYLWDVSKVLILAVSHL